MTVLKGKDGPDVDCVTDSYLKQPYPLNSMEVVMTLQKKLNAIKEKSMATKPAEVLSIMQDEVSKLIEAGIAGNVIATGKPLPEFSLPDEEGNFVNSKELLAKGPLALSFYRGVW